MPCLWDEDEMDRNVQELIDAKQPWEPNLHSWTADQSERNYDRPLGPCIGCWSALKIYAAAGIAILALYGIAAWLIGGAK